MDEGKRPRIVTSKKQIKYRKSSWRIHDFQVWSGDLLCCVAVLKMQGSALLWVGDMRSDLGEVALGMPAQAEGRGALSSSLLGAEAGAAPLARQLALVLRQPVYVCCGATFDRFSSPLVARGLIAEIKSRPECF